jgi:amino acid transporter
MRLNSNQAPHQEDLQSCNNNPSLPSRLKCILFGSPRDLKDRSIFHRLALAPLLAWIGMGADGLSSSSYGPQEAFITLGEHTYLAVGLAILTAATVIIISSAYSLIIEEFPHGGGGYVVATKLLGARLGLTSGSALLVDYVLTITVSIAAAGDAIFSFLPAAWHGEKFIFEMLLIAGLTTLNIRGVRESVIALAPIFIVFLITHVIVIGGGIASHASLLPATAHKLHNGFEQGLATLGLGGMFLLLAHAYSLGGGTYTGIEAVSNGLPLMREPRVENGKRTMIYLAASLAFTATGLILCYLLWNTALFSGKTMNAILVERLAGGWPFGGSFVILTLLSEGALLIVGAQAGFIGGPRILTNLAVDSWVPRRFAALSERLTTQNGIVLMGCASFLTLLYTHGNIHHLVVMYSINVFLTFSLATFGMARLWFQSRGIRPHWKRRFSLLAIAFLLCATILIITVTEKFQEGGWITLMVTASLISLCSVIRRHYRKVGDKLAKLYIDLEKAVRPKKDAPGILDPSQPTAAILVANYGGLGIHTVLNVFRVFPGYFKNLIFVSVGVIDSGAFKGEEAIEVLRGQTESMLQKYVELGQGLGIPSTSKFAIGTDAVDEGEKICLEVATEFPKATFFAGKIIFQRERWYQRLLHNETAFAIEKRLQLAGKTMVILPARVP